MDTRRLRAAIFERSGIAIDEHDPIMAVVAACAQQTEEIGALLLRRTNPARIVVAVTVAAAIFAVAGTRMGWVLAQQRFQAERAGWLGPQNEPRLGARLHGGQGRGRGSAPRRGAGAA